MYRSRKTSRPDQWKSIKGFALDEVEDAAGAGDWCSSGIIQQMCMNGSKDFFNSSVTKIENALRYGQALGALNCLYDGARGLMYVYKKKNLLDLVDTLIKDKNVEALKLRHKPMIDISTALKFSSLY